MPLSTLALMPTAAHGQQWEELHFSQPRPTAEIAVSDGRKWAGYELLDRTARLINTESGSMLSLRPPERCANRHTSNGQEYSYGGLVAIGGGQSMWSCRTPESIRLYDVNRRRWRNPRLPEEPYTCEAGRYARAVGRWWFSETCTGNHTYGVVYTKWRTGKERVDQYGNPFPRLATSMADLNARTGQRRMCEPLERTKNPNAFDYDL